MEEILKNEEELRNLPRGELRMLRTNRLPPRRPAFSGPRPVYSSTLHSLGVAGRDREGRSRVCPALLENPWPGVRFLALAPLDEWNDFVCLLCCLHQLPIGLACPGSCPGPDSPSSSPLTCGCSLLTSLPRVLHHHFLFWDSASPHPSAGAKMHGLFPASSLPFLHLRRQKSFTSDDSHHSGEGNLEQGQQPGHQLRFPLLRIPKRDTLCLLVSSGVFR